MAKQTFTTGQILTAAQMTSLQETAMGGGAATAKTTSYVLTAADAGTTVAMNSSGATTITVNTGLFAAGDTVFIQNLGTGVCTITAGTATVNSAGSLALPQYDGGILYFTSASAAIFYDYIQAGMTSPLTTKGDLWTYTTTDARLASSGVNNQVLTVDTSTASGLKWAAPVASGLTWTLLNSPSGTALTGAQDITISGISNRTDLLIVFESASSASASSDIKLRINGATTNYGMWYTINTVATTYATTNFGVQGGFGSNAFDICKMSSNAGSETFGYVRLDGCTTNRVAALFAGGGSANTGSSAEFRVGAGIYDGSAAVTSITLRSNTGNWDAGTVWVYGA